MYKDVRIRHICNKRLTCDKHNILCISFPKIPIEENQIQIISLGSKYQL